MGSRGDRGRRRRFRALPTSFNDSGTRPGTSRRGRSSRDTTPRSGLHKAPTTWTTDSSACDGTARTAQSSPTYARWPSTAMTAVHPARSQPACLESRQAWGRHVPALIAKGLIYAPEHGIVAFTVPGMAASSAARSTAETRPDPQACAHQPPNPRGRRPDHGTVNPLEVDVVRPESNRGTLHYEKLPRG